MSFFACFAASFYCSFYVSCPAFYYCKIFCESKLKIADVRCRDIFFKFILPPSPPLSLSLRFFPQFLLARNFLVFFTKLLYPHCHFFLYFLHFFLYTYFPRMFTFLQINSSSDYTPTFSDVVILFCPRFGGLTSGGHVYGLRS